MADAAWPLLVLCWPPATATAIDPRLWLRGTLVRVQVRRLHGLAVAERRPADGHSGIGGWGVTMGWAAKRW